MHKKLSSLLFLFAYFCFISWFFLGSAFVCAKSFRKNKKIKKINRFEIVLIASFYYTTDLYPLNQPIEPLLHAIIFICNRLWESLWKNLFFVWKYFLSDLWPSVRISSFYEDLFYLWESLDKSLFFLWKSFFICNHLFFIRTLFLFCDCENLFIWDHLFLLAFRTAYGCQSRKVGSKLRSRFSAEVHLNGIFTASHWFQREESRSYGIRTLFTNRWAC